MLRIRYNLHALYIGGDMAKNKKRKTDYFKNDGYPVISNRLLDCLKFDFPDSLPRKNISEYELGVLVGQQQVIDKLISEKNFMEGVEDV